MDCLFDIYTQYCTNQLFTSDFVTYYGVGIVYWAGRGGRVSGRDRERAPVGSAAPLT